MASPVKRIEQFSTGTVDIHPQHAYRGQLLAGALSREHPLAS